MADKRYAGPFEQPILPSNVLGRHVFRGNLKNVRKANPDLMNEAERVWGYTEDPSKGGFILSDGRMLNMNNGEMLPNELNREAHREIFGILKLVGEPCTQDEAIDLFELLTGGIRFYFGRFDSQMAFSLCVHHILPTTEQKKRLQELAEIAANFHYDIFNRDGRMLYTGKGMNSMDMAKVFGLAEKR